MRKHKLRNHLKSLEIEKNGSYLDEMPSMELRSRHTGVTVVLNFARNLEEIKRLRSMVSTVAIIVSTVEKPTKKSKRWKGSRVPMMIEIDIRLLL
jgi:hypothetical protein